MAQQEIDDLKLDSAEWAKVLQETGAFEDINIDSFPGNTLPSGGFQQIQNGYADVVPNSAPRQRRRVSATNNNQPYVEIVEEPRSRGLRFRYECEGRSAGSIVGENSTVEKKTFPTIKIHNHNKPAVVVVSCVTKDDPARPHPHSLVGRDCQQGVCTIKLKTIRPEGFEFQGLGIQCAKKKEVGDALKRREDIRVDPFATGFSHKNSPVSIDLNVVRLCFQVFLPDQNGKFTRIITPVVSQPIFDKKAKCELTICRVDKHAGSVKGGEEVFILTEKVNSKDIVVRFFEENSKDGLIWEDYATFGQGDVHRQYAIVFKTPPYYEQTIKNPVNVYMQLKRPSDGEISEPKPFQYKPLDEDPEGIEGKRKRKKLCVNSFVTDLQTEPPPFRFDSNQSSAVSNVTREKLSEKIKAGKHSTKVKQENAGSSVNMDIGQINEPPWGKPSAAFGSAPNQLSWSRPSAALGAAPELPSTLGESVAVTSSSVMWSASSVTFAGMSESSTASTINRSAFAELTAINGPPKSFTQQTFTSPAPVLTAQNLLGSLAEGGSTDTMDPTQFDQQLTISSPSPAVYLTETEAGLTGDLVSVDYDPNIAAHENVVSMEEDDLQLKSSDLREIEDFVMNQLNKDSNAEPN